MLVLLRDFREAGEGGGSGEEERAVVEKVEALGPVVVKEVVEEVWFVIEIVLVTTWSVKAVGKQFGRSVINNHPWS